MSVEWLTWAFRQRLGDAGAKAVLVAICNYANPINTRDPSVMGIIPELLKPHVAQLGFSFPSQRQVADMTDMGERTVRRHIGTLEERDLLVCVERRRDDGRKSSSGYLLITSPAKLAAGTSPANFDTTSPANLAATYEDTQGLIQKDGIITPTASSVNKPPLPPFHVSEHLRQQDWATVHEAAMTPKGKVSVDYLVDQYEAWLERRGIYPRHVLPHFLKFIEAHKRRNKL